MAQSWDADVWLDRLANIDEGVLENLVPVLDVTQTCEAHRWLNRFVRQLLDAKDMRESLELPLDEYLREMFRRWVAYASLKRGAQKPSAALDAWCQQVLERRADEGERNAKRVIAWCILLLLKYADSAPHSEVLELLNEVLQAALQQDDTLGDHVEPSEPTESEDPPSGPATPVSTE